ncbi:MAG: Spo0E family sporulation regulatory protein-aspartic acid phosphatase [Peptococcaceae bacterium]
MTDTSISEMKKEMERIRGRLYGYVKDDVNLLLDKETYRLSVQLDELIVRLMKKERNRTI